MENTNGNTGPTSRMESANGSSAAADKRSVPNGDPIAIIETSLERAIDLLTYGRRQEAESTICILREAQSQIAEIRTPR